MLEIYPNYPDKSLDKSPLLLYTYTNTNAKYQLEIIRYVSLGVYPLAVYTPKNRLFKSTLSHVFGQAGVFQKIYPDNSWIIIDTGTVCLV